MNIRDFNKKNVKEEDVKSAYDKYKNLSQNQLMQELFATVNKQKQDGTFDKNQLLNMISAIAPSLSDEQRQRLYSLLDML